MPELLPSLSAFFPAHNEEGNVVAMVDALRLVLPRVAARWEIVVVDDGSTDRTGALAEDLARRDERVRVVRHAANRGYGGAIKSGLAAARYEWIFYTDGDRQFDPGQITRLIAELGRADVVIGYRHHRADRLVRRLNGVAWNTLVRLLIGLRVRDIDCAFKLLPRAALDGLALEAEGAMISTELLARLKQRGCRIVQVPVDHFPRRTGTPSGGSPLVIARAFAELFRLSRRLRRPPREANREAESKRGTEKHAATL
ncbi:MAG TPA: glycosyltransferase family 2 protein [Candidatus Binatia bacterium]|nr:glycosyltransferase family 2 protein [Candidatus Binatia bacterium]